jgi:hypothetical protein
MDEPTRATSPEDFGPASTIITLPVPGPGGRELRAEIQAAELDELIPYLKALPGEGRDMPAEKEYVEQRGELDATLEFVRKYDAQAREIVKRWMVAPLVSFDGPKPGYIEWKHVHLQNRVAIVNAISRFSSRGSAGVELATFPAVEQGGGRDGGGTGGAGQNGDATAPLATAPAGEAAR